MKKLFLQVSSAAFAALTVTGCVQVEGESPVVCTPDSDYARHKVVGNDCPPGMMPVAPAPTTTSAALAANY